MRYKIYIGHSRDPRLNYLVELYQPLIASLSEDSIIVPHVSGAESEINSEVILPSCNLMIAEVSYPSTGLGMELAWASAANIPVLCIHKASCGPSSSIVNAFSNILSYENAIDMVNQVVNWIFSNKV